MLDILKYDGKLEPQEHLLFNTRPVNENDLTKKEVGAVMVKKFKENLLGEALI